LLSVGMLGMAYSVVVVEGVKQVRNYLTGICPDREADLIYTINAG
jgi:hypothetical protein